MRLPDLLAFKEESRGSSEAISTAILFMVILTAVSGMAVVGNNMIDTSQEQQSIDQNMNTMQLLNSNIAQLGDDIGNAETNRAFRTQRINTYGTTIETVPKTIIDIGSYTVESDPFEVTSTNYDMVYDSGIIAQDADSGFNTRKTPYSNEYTNEHANYFPLVTTNYSVPTFPSGQLKTQVVLLERTTAPEVATVSSGTDITVETANTAMWVKYLNQADYITVDSISPSTDTIEAHTTDQMTIYHYEVKIQESQA